MLNPYPYALVVVLVFCLVAFFVLALHFQLFSFIKTPLLKSCLTKKQAILVSIVAVLFELGAFFIIFIKALQIFIDRSAVEYRDCYLFQDCDDEKYLEIMLALALIISAGMIGVQLFRLKGFSAVRS